MPKTSVTANGFNKGELALWARLFEPADAVPNPDVARYLLTLRFPPSDIKRMNQLAEKARAGSLMLEEQIELDDYERVGTVLSLMKSKARQTLKPALKPARVAQRA